MVCIRWMFNVIIWEFICSYKGVKINISILVLLMILKCKYILVVIVRVVICCEKLNFFFLVLDKVKLSSVVV